MALAIDIDELTRNNPRLMIINETNDLNAQFGHSEILIVDKWPITLNDAGRAILHGHSLLLH